MSITAIIVAAGRGARMGGDVPKQYRKLGDRTVLGHALNRFATHPAINEIILVMNENDASLLRETTEPPAICRTVNGGATRAASVLAGLEAVSDRCSHVLIHDGARPLVSHALINKVIHALAEYEGAAPALPVTDALWKVEDGKIAATHPREGLYRAQTPQGFSLTTILAAHRAAKAAQAADDVELALAHGVDVALVEGEEDNIKLTHPDDFARAERYLEAQMDIRTGTGFDVHAFGPGDHVMLCGVAVPHSRGLSGHSDADVGMHAITDAIYGALCAGDIGTHFPPSDQKWKDADSSIFLEHSCQLASKNGFRVNHVDCTLICELPKVGPFSDAMRTRLSEIMNIPSDRISVKATTSERLGFTGRGEGIAALASATLVTG